MRFDEDLEMYVAEMAGVIFAFEDEPDEGYEERLKSTAEKYWNNLDSIVEFMMPDLQEMYGDVDVETIKEKLGRPVIYPDGGLVNYLEQSFDNIHIFSFEFLDDEFQDLQYFAVDG